MTDLRWKTIANGGIHGVGRPWWRHKAVCITGKSMPGAGEAVGRAAVRVRRNSALVYSARRKRLRSMNGAAGIRHSWNEKRRQPIRILHRDAKTVHWQVTEPSVPYSHQTKCSLQTYLLIHRYRIVHSRHGHRFSLCLFPSTQLACILSWYPECRCRNHKNNTNTPVWTVNVMRQYTN